MSMLMQMKLKEPYLKKCHNVTYRLYQFREEIRRCQFNSEQTKNKILQLIGEFIEKIKLNQPAKNPDRNEIIKQLHNCLNEEQNNNNIEYLFKIIQDMNSDQKVHQNQNNNEIRQFVFWRKNRISAIQHFLNQNATILVTERKLYAFNNHCKLIKTFQNKFSDFNQFIHMKHHQQYVLMFHNVMIIYNNSWESQQILKAHNHEVNTLITNEAEDLIISGSFDKTIRFWNQDNLQWSCQQILNIELEVRCLSLNQDQTKLLSCGKSSIIYLMEIQKDNQWIITQQIKVDKGGSYLCFISQNRFIFHPYSSGVLQIFNFENDSRQYIESKLLLYSNQFSQHASQHYFNKKTKVLTFSDDYRIYFYHFKEDEDFEFKYSINIGKNCFRPLNHDIQLTAIGRDLCYQTQNLFIVQVREKH